VSDLVLASPEFPQPVAVLVESDQGPLILVQRGYQGPERIEVAGVLYRVVVCRFRASWGTP
jgi:hypothetical protein